MKLFDKDSYCHDSFNALGLFSVLVRLKRTEQLTRQENVRKLNLLHFNYIV